MLLHFQSGCIDRLFISFYFLCLHVVFANDFLQARVVLVAKNVLHCFGRVLMSPKNIWPCHLGKKRRAPSSDLYLTITRSVLATVSFRKKWYMRTRPRYPRANFQKASHNSVNTNSTGFPFRSHPQTTQWAGLRTVKTTSETGLTIRGSCKGKLIKTTLGLAEIISSRFRSLAENRREKCKFDDSSSLKRWTGHTADGSLECFIFCLESHLEN